MAEAGAGLEPTGSTLTRKELVKRGTAAAFGVGLFGALGERAGAFAGPMKYAKRQLKGNLSILQWAHFVPSYDVWLDGTYIKEWGQRNDVNVTIDHINNTLLPSAAAAEAAAQKGHDLVQFLFPPSALEHQTIPLNDVVEEVTSKLGKMSDVGYKSTYNPKTKHYFGFADNYVPDPFNYRHSMWYDAGIAPSTWDNVLKAAPKLRAAGHPLGLGMSNELDSDMFLMSLLYCFGAALQTPEGVPNINTKETVEALKFMKALYQAGETNEVFAWTPASNNQAMLAGQISCALNAISISRSAESGNVPFADDIWIRPLPKGPVRALGNEHVMGVYFIWRFAQNKENAKKYLVDQQLDYKEHFIQSQFYNFPGWTNAVPGGFKTIRKLTAADKHKPLGQYTVLTTIAERYTTNVGYPGFANAAVGDIFNQFLVPQMFAQVAQGKMAADEAARSMQGQFKSIYGKWKEQKLI